MALQLIEIPNVEAPAPALLMRRVKICETPGTVSLGQMR